MNIDQIVTLLLALGAIAYTIITTMNELANKKRQPEEEEDEGFIEETAVEVKLPPPPPVTTKRKPLRTTTGPDEKFIFRSKIEDYKPKTAIEERKLALRQQEEIVSEDMLLQTEGVLYKRQKKTPIGQMVKSLPSKKILVISSEVINTPVGMRSSPFPRNI